MNRLYTRLLPFALIAAIGLLALSSCRDDLGPVIRAQISVSPNPVQFVQSEIGVEEEQILQIENTSPAELVITRIALTENPESVFALNLLSNEAPTADLPLRIAPGERISIIVAFTRPAARQYSGVLTISSNAAVANLTVPLQTAQSAAVIATDPRDLVFGRVRLDTTSTRTLGIRNTGDAPMTITGIVGGFANPQLSFTPDADAENPFSALQFPLTIAPGNENEIFVDVSCSPTSEGNISGEIIIQSPDAINTTDGNYVVRVTCNGPEPCLEVRDSIGRVNEDGIDFGFASIGARNSRNLTVNNCAAAGGEALVVQSIDLTEDPDDKYSLNLDGLEFPLELSPGGGVPFSMIYEPTDNETNTAVVTFRSNDVLQDPLDVDVIGVGTDNEPPIAALRCRITNVEPTPFTSDDFTTIPFVNALCDTEGSTDPDGDAIVAWEWEIIRPNDPLPLVRDTQEIEFSINAVGEYDVRVWVIDERGARSELPAELTITSTPESEILCRLRWSHRFGGTEDSVDPQCRPGQCADGCGVDLDIHLTNSTQGGWFDRTSAVYFGALTQVWPDGSEGSLDFDVLFGIGPESASVKRPSTGVTYSCGVHFWNSYGWGEYADATMEVYVFGALIGSPQRRLNQTGEFWPGVSIQWNGTSTSPSDIFLSDTVYASVCDAPGAVTPCNVTPGQNTANRCW